MTRSLGDKLPGGETKEADLYMNKYRYRRLESQLEVRKQMFWMS